MIAREQLKIKQQKDSRSEFFSPAWTCRAGHSQAEIPQLHPRIRNAATLSDCESLSQHNELPDREVKQGCFLSLLLEKTLPCCSDGVGGCRVSIYWCLINGAAVSLLQWCGYTCMPTQSLWSPVLWFHPQWPHLSFSLTQGRQMSQNLTLLLPAGIVTPPHISAAQLDSVVVQQWTKHHFSVQFSCSFVLLCMTRSPHENILVLEGFNTSSFSSLWRSHSADTVIGLSKRVNDKYESSLAQS